MSDDLLESSGGIVSADSVIDELRAAQEAYSEFFGDVFDQFQAISLDLLARHKNLESLGQQQAVAMQQQAELTDELKRVRGLLETLTRQA